MAVQVSKAVYEGLKAARESGEYNMFERHNVCDWLWRNKYYDASIWANNHPRAYNRLILEGPEVIEDIPPSE